MLDIDTKAITVDDVKQFIYDIFPDCSQLIAFPKNDSKDFIQWAVYFKYPGFFRPIRLNVRVEQAPTRIIFDNIHELVNHTAFASTHVYQFYNTYYKTDKKLNLIELKYYKARCSFNDFKVIKSFTECGEKVDFNLSYSIMNKVKDRDTNRMMAKFTDLHFVISRQGVEVQNHFPSTFLNYMFSFLNKNKTPDDLAFFNSFYDYSSFNLDEMMADNVSAIANKNMLLMAYGMDDLNERLPDLSLDHIYNSSKENVIYYLNFLETLDSVDDI